MLYLKVYDSDRRKIEKKRERDKVRGKERNNRILCVYVRER